ncbi:hypothetical protein SOVF_027490 [Spinacia oleracea]|nr:hypothetical protein SOVF_027490 [Spinacia oleracea]
MRLVSQAHKPPRLRLPSPPPLPPPPPPTLPPPPPLPLQAQLLHQISRPPQSRSRPRDNEAEKSTCVEGDLKRFRRSEVRA